MTAAMAMPGNTAETFLVHFFGTGLVDDRYVVERFRTRADGDIVPAPAEALAAKGRRTTTCCSACNFDPAVSSRFNSLSSRSAHNPRADQQAAAGGALSAS